MMTGEFEYEGLIENAQFPQLTYIFFLVFMIIMTIIVVNLLIGEYLQVCKMPKGTSMYYASMFWGFFDPSLPLSSNISI